jgi:putative SOS response-associated peptidase YedK
MCSRFEIEGESDRIEERFDLVEGPEYMPAAEVRPTDRVPVIGPDRRAIMMRWGLEVSWDRKPLINARAETLARKRTFLPLLAHRILVPASAYFEWRAEGKAKIKTRIARKDRDLFAFAGLADGSDFTIVTCGPAPEIANIRTRMPVILEPEGEAEWLDAASPFDTVARLLTPLPGEQLVARELVAPPRQGQLF